MDNQSLELRITQAWKGITPFWPLQNLIAVNPLSGFEDLPFEEALKEGGALFESESLPEEMHEVNRKTIQWLQVYYDQGQSTIRMPLREQGLWRAIKKLLAIHDAPDEPLEVIREGFRKLTIEDKDQTRFMTLLLTTLPGWAAYIKHHSTQNSQDALHDYLALRVYWVSHSFKEARTLLNQQEPHSVVLAQAKLQKILQYERHYLNHLIEKLGKNKAENSETKPEAQLVFCIDVRSEPFRRAIEKQGAYHTFGFAGFFGLPIGFSDCLSGDTYSACPVLLTPSYSISLRDQLAPKQRRKHQRTQLLKKLYQSLKFNLLTPFPLVEFLGGVAGIAMAKNTFRPRAQSRDAVPLPTEEAINQIPEEVQLRVAFNALCGMGLTSHFADLVVFCGHGAKTTNNPYASALDCGACAGRQGGMNAYILATVLNKNVIRTGLKEKGISIPQSTYFLAGQHCTTTDACHLYDHNVPDSHRDTLQNLKSNLLRAQEINLKERAAKFGKNLQSITRMKQRAHDWAQVRPEWGLAGNASFIVGPRQLTAGVDLNGRSFLHSYDWRADQGGEILTGILTAPLVVAQWINCQYLFSSLNNVAYGGGSKITQNITGKIGLMQGNASDLMNGLSLQSVNQSDHETYHEPIRLHAVIRAPQERIKKIITQHALLKTLVSNQWIFILCLDPQTDQRFSMTRDLEWELLTLTPPLLRGVPGGLTDASLHQRTHRSSSCCADDQ